MLKIVTRYSILQRRVGRSPSNTQREEHSLLAVLLFDIIYSRGYSVFIAVSSIHILSIPHVLDDDGNNFVTDNQTHRTAIFSVHFPRFQFEICKIAINYTARFNAHTVTYMKMSSGMLRFVTESVAFTLRDVEPSSKYCFSIEHVATRRKEL